MMFRLVSFTHGTFALSTALRDLLQAVDTEGLVEFLAPSPTGLSPIFSTTSRNIPPSLRELIQVFDNTNLPDLFEEDRFKEGIPIWGSRLAPPELDALAHVVVEELFNKKEHHRPTHPAARSLISVGSFFSALGVLVSTIQCKRAFQAIYRAGKAIDALDRALPQFPDHERFIQNLKKWHQNFSKTQGYTFGLMAFQGLGNATEFAGLIFSENLIGAHNEEMSEHAKQTFGVGVSIVAIASLTKLVFALKHFYRSGKNYLCSDLPTRDIPEPVRKALDDYHRHMFIHDTRECLGETCISLGAGGSALQIFGALSSVSPWILASFLTGGVLISLYNSFWGDSPSLLKLDAAFLHIDDPTLMLQELAVLLENKAKLGNPLSLKDLMHILPDDISSQESSQSHTPPHHVIDTEPAPQARTTEFLDTPTTVRLQRIGSHFSMQQLEHAPPLPDADNAQQGGDGTAHFSAIVTMDEDVPHGPSPQDLRDLLAFLKTLEMLHLLDAIRKELENNKALGSQKQKTSLFNQLYDKHQEDTPGHMNVTLLLLSPTDPEWSTSVQTIQEAFNQALTKVLAKRLSEEQQLLLAQLSKHKKEFRLRDSVQTAHRDPAESVV